MVALHFQATLTEAEVHLLAHFLLQVEDPAQVIQVEAVVEQGLLVRPVAADQAVHLEVVEGNKFVSKG